MTITQEIGDTRSEGIHLGNLGSVYQQQGQLDQAIAHYKQGIAIPRDIGDRRS